MNKINKNSIFQKIAIRNYGFIVISLSILMIISLIPVKTKACSTFFLKNGSHYVVGRNLDYPFSEFMVTVNKRNVAKTAFSYAGESVSLPLSWVSKYGSITYNMFGREITPDGMNEAGLVISVLILDESEYPVIAGKPSISLDNWVQYLLDNYATVEEVVASCSEVNIRYNPVDYWRLHFFVSDANGNNATLEFIDGELVLHTKETLAKKAITNSLYESSIAYYNGGVQSGNATSSLNRFFNVATMLDNYDNEEPISYAYDVLAACAQRITVRSMVYDITNKRVYVFTAKNTNTRYFDFSSFDFSCDKQVLVYNETLTDEGEISGSFVPYTSQLNKELIEPGWQFMGMSYTEASLTEFSQYPESFSCIPTFSHQIFSENKPLKVYPNPVNEVLSVELPLYENNQMHVSIVNIAGKIVYDKVLPAICDDGNLNLDINYLQNGLYILNIQSEKETYSQKFIKNKSL